MLEPKAPLVAVLSAERHCTRAPSNVTPCSVYSGGATNEKQTGTLICPLPASQLSSSSKRSAVGPSPYHAVDQPRGAGTTSADRIALVDLSAEPEQQGIFAFTHWKDNQAMMKPELTTAKHQILLATMVLLVPLALCQIFGVAVMRQSLAFRDPAMPQVADFTVSVPIALILIAMRATMLKASKPAARAVLLPGKRDCAFRVERFSTALFKCFYFAAITGFGYYVMKDEKWFPTSLGGSGDFLESLRVFREPPPAALTLYMAIQFAFQLHNLLYVLLLKAIDSSTMEIVAHDLIAMLLISAAHLTNYTAGGAIVAFINDASDIFLHPFFMATASGRKSIVAPLLATLVVSWAYLRLLVFPRDGLYNYIVVSPRENPDMSMLFLHPLNTLFTLLVGLHVYWLVAFTRKGLDELRKAPADVQLSTKPTIAQ